MVHLTTGGIAILVVGVLTLTFGVMLYRNPQRGEEMLGALAAFVLSIWKTVKGKRPPTHPHRRHGDRDVHVHRRAMDEPPDPAVDTDRSLKRSHRQPRRASGRQSMMMTIRAAVRRHHEDDE